MSRLHDALDDIAARAPEIQPRRGLYRSARRRRKARMALSAVAVIAVVALVAPFSRLVGRTSSEVGGGGPTGLPDRLTTAPWWTSSDPAGPASVVYAGNRIPQSDHEDFPVAWWRPGYSVYPSVAVGLYADTYRIVRAAYSTGTELSPDGRYLLVPDRKVLDLSTGKTRQVLPEKPEWPVSGGWSFDGKRILFVEDRVTTVVAWPSLQVEARFRHPDQAPVTQDVALSQDGSRLAVHSDGKMSVYKADGTLVWTSPEDLTSDITHGDFGRMRIGGRAAWHPDGRLVVFGRSDLTCDDCPVHPGTWTLEMVDGLFDSTPGPVVAPSYPVLRSVLDARIVAWRGDDAYAVVTWSKDGTGEPGRVGLIRLRPGEGAFDWVLKAPDGVTSMQVATDHVDTTRPVGDPMYGFNTRELLGRVASGACCFVPIVVLAVVFAALRRRRRG